MDRPDETDVLPADEGDLVEFGTFFDGKLTKQEIYCLASFDRLGHAVTVFFYKDIALPRGVICKDAPSIMPEETFFRMETGPDSHCRSPSPFSNLFRYHVIKQTGLVWTDRDVFCLRADWPGLPVLIAWQGPFLVNGAVLCVPADHEVMDEATEAATRMAASRSGGTTAPSC